MYKRQNLKGATEAIWEFNKGLIDALYDVVPAVKPQSAFYEMYGLCGEEVMHRTISYAKEKGLYIIDVYKRQIIFNGYNCLFCIKNFHHNVKTF